MTEPDPIVERLAATATDMVEQAGVVGRTLSQEIGSPKGLSAANLITAMTTLTNVALAGGLDVAKAGADAMARPGARAVSDRMAAITRRMISESGKVAGNASDRLDSTSLTLSGVSSEWVKTMVSLTDIAIFGGIELAETALAGPGQYEKAPLVQTYSVTPDADHPRLLTMTELSRPGAADTAADQVGFDPADRILPKGEREFSILVTTAGLASGMYIGQIHLGDVDPDAPAGVVEDDVVINVTL